MDYRNWYCVMVASGCENKVMSTLLARKAVLEDTFITDIAVPEVTELVFDKANRRKSVKNKVLPGYVLVQVAKDIVENEEGEEVKVFPAFTQKTIKDTPNVLGFAGANKNKPRVMRPSEVKNVFDRAGRTTKEVDTTPTAVYTVGEVLEAISGPFAGTDIVVAAVQGNKILAQVDMFDRTIPAEFSLNQVQPKEVPSI